jgi:hypothetical protein
MAEFQLEAIENQSQRLEINSYERKLKKMKKKI